MRDEALFEGLGRWAWALMMLCRIWWNRDTSFAATVSCMTLAEGELARENRVRLEVKRW